MAEGKIAIDQELIRELALLLDQNDLSEIEVEQHGLRVRVARRVAVTSIAPPAAAGAPGQAAPAMPSDPAGMPSDVVADFAKHPGVVVSPMVGTAYRAGEPGGKPFVDVGTPVKAGDMLLIIEAMKTMNQIPAPRAGTVTQVLFDDGQPVEFGEPLMIIE
jgi:acetyl-CoA carboxylase biotin carboxyl carrier protein